jgi:hypothetical protein
MIGSRARISMRQFTVPSTRCQQGECGFAVNHSHILFWEVDAEDYSFVGRTFERSPEQIRYGLFEICLTRYDLPSWAYDDCVGCKGGTQCLDVASIPGCVIGFSKFANSHFVIQSIDWRFKHIPIYLGIIIA